MSNELVTQPEGDKEFENSLNGLYGEFTRSMNAMQMQDLHTSEQSLLKARNYYRIISGKVDEKDLMSFKVIVNAIDVITRVVRSTFYGIEERYKKSLEELGTAGQLCKEAEDYFTTLDEQQSEGLESSRFYFIFFNCIICSSWAQYQGMVDAADGKFVDEVAVMAEAIRQLRRINDYPFPHDEGDLGVGMVALLNKMADLNEKKLEKLEEKRKRIEFMRPIGRKVFIVHGHDEAILTELKDNLKKALDLEPIVLKEMKDDGRTLIEKFEGCAKDCAFAFVIVTPDDMVESKAGKYFQGRPNVLFELGWFCGRYGRDKVRILRQRDTPLPSDLNGLMTIDFQEKLAEVFGRIGNDLESYGIVGRRG